MMTSSSSQRTVGQRLSEHFLRRLQHSYSADLIAASIENGLIEAAPFEFEGKSYVRFRSSASASAKTEHELLHAIQEFEGLGLGFGPRNRFIYEDGEIVVDEFFEPPRIKRNGAREISARRNAPEAAPVASNGLRRRKPDSVDLLKLIRQNIVRPLAGDVAAFLLLADGINDVGLTPAEILALISKPRSITTILCDVDGFEERVLQLLERGLLLPGETVITKLGQTGSRAEVRTAARRGVRRNVVTIVGSLYSPDTDDKWIAEATKGHLPILAISEFKTGIPKCFRAVSDRRVGCPGLSPRLLSQTIEIVTGEHPESAFGDLDLRYRNRPVVTAEILL